MLVSIFSICELFSSLCNGFLGPSASHFSSVLNTEAMCMDQLLAVIYITIYIHLHHLQFSYNDQESEIKYTTVY